MKLFWTILRIVGRQYKKKCEDKHRQSSAGSMKKKKHPYVQGPAKKKKKKIRSYHLSLSQLHAFLYARYKRFQARTCECERVWLCVSKCQPCDESLTCPSRVPSLVQRQPAHRFCAPCRSSEIKPNFTIARMWFVSCVGHVGCLFLNKMLYQLNVSKREAFHFKY